MVAWDDLRKALDDATDALNDSIDALQKAPDEMAPQGFATGGIVPGTGPRRIIAYGGETIISRPNLRK